jgi:hypothetical protein
MINVISTWPYTFVGCQLYHRIKWLLNQPLQDLKVAYGVK